MSVWAVGIFKLQETIYTHDVKVPAFMEGRDINQLLEDANPADGLLMRVILTEGYTPPVQWNASNPAFSANAGGNDLLLIGDNQRYISDLAWEKQQ